MEPLRLVLLSALVLAAGCAAPPVIPGFTRVERDFVVRFVGALEAEGRGELYFTRPGGLRWLPPGDFPWKVIEGLVSKHPGTAEAVCGKFFDRAAASWENYVRSFAPGGGEEKNRRARALLGRAGRDFTMGRNLRKAVLKAVPEAAGRLEEHERTAMERLDPEMDW